MTIKSHLDGFEIVPVLRYNHVVTDAVWGHPFHFYDMVIYLATLGQKDQEEFRMFSYKLNWVRRLINITACNRDLFRLELGKLQEEKSVIGKEIS